MADKIRVCIATLDALDETGKVTSTKLRGYSGYFFLDDSEFHHHGDDPYHYPLIQYKKINGKLIVMGLQEYSNILMNKIPAVSEIITDKGNVKVRGAELTTEELEIKEERVRYRFMCPWLALNDKNYKIFRDSNDKNRKELLEKIVVGNTLSAMKGLGIFVKHKLKAEFFYYKPVVTKAHGNVFEGLFGEFELNINLPKFFGLGKSVSKGFGTVERVT